MSTLRDLLFHVQEHRYTLPQIQICLSELGLKFCGFQNQNIIKKFGRFPYRNKALGRPSTPQEEEFLLDPPPWGKTKSEMEELERKHKLNNKIRKV